MRLVRRRAFRSLASLVLLSALVACGRGPSSPLEVFPQVNVELDQEFSLAPGQHASIDAIALDVRFDSVSSDSRCPMGVLCIWSGDADVHLRIQRGKRMPTPVVLRVFREPRSVVDVEERIELRSLTPFRTIDHTIEPSEYRVGLVIRKAQ